MGPMAGTGMLEPLALSIFQGHLSFITNPFKRAQNLILEGKFSQVS